MSLAHTGSIPICHGRRFMYSCSRTFPSLVNNISMNDCDVNYGKKSSPPSTQTIVCSTLFITRNNLFYKPPNKFNFRFFATQVIPSERRNGIFSILISYYQSLVSHLLKEHADLQSKEIQNKQILLVR